MLSIDVILFDFSIECRAANSQEFCRFGDIVGTSIERFDNQPFFPLIDAKSFQLSASTGIAEREIDGAD